MLKLVYVFTPASPFISGNQKNRMVVRRMASKSVPMMVTTKPAKAQAEYFERVATQAVLEANWAIPDYVCMDIVAINIDADADNIRKTVSDPLEHIIYENDRRVKDGRTVLMRDKGPSRILVAVQAVHGKAYGYGKPSRKKG